jgi:hypothetical protein
MNNGEALHRTAPAEARDTDLRYGRPKWKGFSLFSHGED